VLGKGDGRAKEDIGSKEKDNRGSLDGSRKWE
jgi:hypothetical protein